MNTSVPYLLPALLDWLVESGCTPHLVLNAEHPEVRVPEGHAVDGQIVLNISPTAVAEFELTREYIFFQTRFQGVPREIYAPLEAVLGIYARETGEGMAFLPRVAANIRPTEDPHLAARSAAKPKVVQSSRESQEVSGRPSAQAKPITGKPRERKEGEKAETGKGGHRPNLRLVRSDEEDS